MARFSWQLLLILLTIKTLHSLKIHNPYRHDLMQLIKEPPLIVGEHRKSTVDVEEHWLDQKVDHFDEHNVATWPMRYYRNAKYHRADGPMYIFVGGEWSITKPLLATGLMHDMAVENGGMLYYTEHRYYGKSWPVTNSTSRNLRFLSVRQSLADLAHFIRFEKATNSQLNNSAVILVGGSYSGSMVAWMTRIYPELVTVSWASSAPLLAKADFYEYMELVTESIRLTHGATCANRIENGMLGLTRILSDENSAQLLLRSLNACDNFNSSDEYDRAAFFNGIGNYFAYIVQSYSDAIPQLCDSLLAMHEDDESALVAYLTALFGESGRLSTDIDCQDFSYAGMLAVFMDINERETGTRQWFYQTCTEFGWYTVTARSHFSTSAATTTSTTTSFGSEVPLRYFERLCLDAFGTETESSSSSSSSPSPTTLLSSSYTLVNMSQGISQTNELFGGNNLSAVTSNSAKPLTYDNVLFTHGQLDPWRAVGLQSAPNAFTVPGYSHVGDLSSIDVLQDSVAMCLSKLRIMSFLRNFLQSAKT